MQYPEFVALPIADNSPPILAGDFVHFVSRDPNVYAAAGVAKFNPLTVSEHIHGRALAGGNPGEEIHVEPYGKVRHVRIDSLNGATEINVGLWLVVSVAGGLEPPSPKGGGAVVALALEPVLPTATLPREIRVMMVLQAYPVINGAG
jgi:hypothetical protein